MSDATDDTKPQLHIDADWKAEAAAEKEKLQKKAEEKAAETPAGDLPEASFSTMVDILASQALSGLGVFADKASGGVIVDLPMAKLNIDLLGIIEEKTSGNLTAEEHAHLQQVLSELRARFVQLAQMIAQQGGVAPSGTAADTATPPGSQTSEDAPRIHTP